MFEYERKPHINYIEGLFKKGSFDEYEKEIAILADKVQSLQTDDVYIEKIAVCVDQCEGICWGDIFIKLHGVNMVSLSFLKDAMGKTLHVLQDGGFEVNEDSIYYNGAIHGFMCTVIAIKCKDAPDIYNGQRRVIIR